MAKERLTEKEMEALRFVRNAIVHEGYSPSVRDLCKALGYGSPRSAFLLINSLINKGVLKRRNDGELQLRRDIATHEDHARTVEIPLVGSVPCGAPLLAEENIEAFIPISTSLARPGSRYFLLRATGDSMDMAGIQDGDILLVRQQRTAENGESVVALIDDEATVKEFRREKDVVVLQPKSRKKSHKPIVLSDNFVIQGIVVAAIPNLK